MPTARIACFGGIYSNYLALGAAVRDARARGVDAMYCLGDVGGFGPHPDRVFPLLAEHNVICLQGNYDHSIGNALADCQCGYTDPRDNYFAQISYDYTLAGTSPQNRRWLGELPAQRRLELGPWRLLFCHGSPRKVNEFLWESTASTHFLDALTETFAADVVLATHTGIKWERELAGGRRFVNVGVLGRPENDGRTNVWYALVEYSPPASSKGMAAPRSEAARSEALRTSLTVEFVPVDYDHRRLAREMQAEGLPAEFIETTLTGWWTTCLEMLPSKERRRGRY